MNFNNTPLGFNMYGGKRVLTEYNKFVKAEYKKIKDDKPTLKGTEIMRLIGQRWRESGKQAKPAPTKKPATKKPATKKPPAKKPAK